MTPSREAHVSALDGLRCLAFLAVFYSHIVGGHGPWGGVGVYCFFALSGFLITGILDRETRRLGAALKRFYWRRSLRIFPLYYLVLAGLFVAHALPAPASYVFYQSNLRIFLQRAFDGPVSHFWSLAVEEQFYILYPLALLVTSRRARPWLIVGLLVASKLMRIALIDAFPWGELLLPVCGEYLLWGALASLALARGWVRVPGRQLVLAGAAIVIAWHWIPQAAWLRGTPDGLGYALIVVGLWTDAAWLVARALALAPLVYLGRISYGLYVYHNLVIGAVTGGPLHALMRPFLVLPVLWRAPPLVELGVTIAVASVSWFAIEQPILRLKDSRLVAKRLTAGNA